MALHVGLRRKVLPGAVVGFSGMLSGPEQVPVYAGGPPILLTHGGADEVIPDMALFVSAAALADKGYAVQWHRVPGLGHGIDPSSLSLAGMFIASAFLGRMKPTATPVSSSIKKT